METIQSPSAPIASAYEGRPSDRIRQYLKELQSQATPGESIRVPPVRVLAKELNVSTATIYHVFKDLTTQGVLQTTVGRGSFLQPPVLSTSQKNICLGISWPNSNDITSRTTLAFQGIIAATMQHSTQISIRAIPRHTFYEGTHRETLLNEAENVDALIYQSHRREFTGFTQYVEEAYEKRGKPIVRLDSPALNATTNFVACDNYSISHRIGKVWAQTGRKFIAYLMRDSFSSTLSTNFTYVGLRNGAELGGLPHTEILSLYNSTIQEEGGYQTMKSYMAKHTRLPDAIYAFGDFLAIGAIRALQESGVSVPEEVSVIGGAGVDHSNSIYNNMTRVKFPFEEVGKQLVNMVVKRIHTHGEAQPSVYVPGKLIGSITTREVENDLFRQAGIMD